MAKYCTCGQLQKGHSAPAPQFRRHRPTNAYYRRQNITCRGYVPDKPKEYYCPACKSFVRTSYRELVLTHMQGKCNKRR